MKHLRSRKGQGTTEYILILALVVGVLFLIYNRVKPKMDDSVNSVADKMSQIK
jgi:hypothetical protein